MKTKFKEFLAKQEEQRRTKLILLESYLDDSMFSKLSMFPFFQALAPLLVPEMKVAHRIIDSSNSLKYYTDRKDGLIWKDEETRDAQIIFVAGHGYNSGKIQTNLENINMQELIEAFKGCDDKLIFFQSCSLFQIESNAEYFLSGTGVPAIVSYTEDFAILDAVIIAYLFLNLFNFFSNPLEHLDEIYQSVLVAFPPAVGWGFSLFK